jgi:hypothetical protein
VQLPADVFPVRISRVRKKDGRVWERTYYFHQKGRGSKTPGPRTALGTDPTAPEFWAKVRKISDSPTLFADVIREYMKSERFTKREESTQDSYEGFLNRYVLLQDEDAIGNVPVDDMTPAIVQACIDGLAGKTGVQATAKTVFKAVDKWAAVRGKLPRQITFGIEVETSDGGREPWPEWAVELALKDAAPWAQRAVAATVSIGQRGSDMIRFQGRDLEGGGVNLRVKKSDKVLWIPLTTDELVLFKSWKIEAFEPLCPHPNGGPFLNSNNLSWWWNRERDINPKLAKIKELGLTMHGLRATRVIRDTLAGLEDADIAALRGMHVQTVRIYMKLAKQRIQAAAAIVRLENGTGAEQGHRKRFAGLRKYDPAMPKTSKKDR